MHLFTDSDPAWKRRRSSFDKEFAGRRRYDLAATPTPTPKLTLLLNPSLILRKKTEVQSSGDNL
jgi:hypothetical protein